MSATAMGTSGCQIIWAPMQVRVLRVTTLSFFFLLFLHCREDTLTKYSLESTSKEAQSEGVKITLCFACTTRSVYFLYG